MPAASRGVSGSPRAKRSAVLRCLVVALISTILLAGLVVLIFWLIVRPKPIEYTVTHAAVRHLNVTSPANNAAAALVNATFYLTFSADNPNRRLSVRYRDVAFSVHYGAGNSNDDKASAPLAVADPVADFRQPPRNETRLAVRAVARSVPVAGETARELEHDRAAGEVGVEVRVSARVRFVVGGVRSRRYDMSAVCSPVVIGLSPAAARSFRSVPCDVAIS
ncbi:NDR1/HIN1-like protein 10 [Brachypodium distachyon]|uniref:Late embryogenesis abundant protein LEA-2 subgroup domain-containing protein n=1 Tax=Brachypodium distachyon TaxID=15368 RepID=I1I5Y1_BRADI|nr:NDR1/HIN1-like protein 10 [Brachypodium distachyon]KQJ97707.1 hypothetical protein BRADI_3g32720v3 [Brachypodium distachyon]|eukprot:XP_003572046.1 NDR1/HIN1-like protein 10 [Brachypodium distachyon]